MVRGEQSAHTRQKRDRGRTLWSTKGSVNRPQRGNVGPQRAVVGVRLSYKCGFPRRPRATGGGKTSSEHVRRSCRRSDGERHGRGLMTMKVLMAEAPDLCNALTDRRTDDLLPYGSSAENDVEAGTARQALDRRSALGARGSTRRSPAVVSRSTLDELYDVGQEGDGLAQCAAHSAHHRR